MYINIVKRYFNSVILRFEKENKELNDLLAFSIFLEKKQYFWSTLYTFYSFINFL